MNDYDLRADGPKWDSHEGKLIHENLSNDLREFFEYLHVADTKQKHGFAIRALTYGFDKQIERLNAINMLEQTISKLGYDFQSHDIEFTNAGVDTSYEISHNFKPWTEYAQEPKTIPQTWQVGERKFQFHTWMPNTSLTDLAYHRLKDAGYETYITIFPAEVYGKIAGFGIYVYKEE